MDAETPAGLKPDGRSPLPDGVSAAHLAQPSGQHASLLPLMLLGAILATGLSGYLGGTRRHFTDAGPAVTLTVETPAVSRTGDVLETVVDVLARQDVAELVIGIDAALWRNVTVNATLPEAGDEEYVDGQYRFTFGQLGTSESFRFQIAQQINPGLFGTNRGRVSVFDGTRRLAQLDVALRVLP
jgi:hypothetical protein